MPTADLRIFRCTSGYNAAGEHVLKNAVLTQQRPMPISVPRLLEVNALAAPLGRPLAYRLKRHELNLVLSFLVTPPVGRVAARTADLKAATRHIRSFVTESVGMGMLTATMRDFYQWNGSEDHLEHFDALPGHLVGRYERRGVRPDLLFLDPSAPRRGTAGEARGRSTKPPIRLTPLKAQRQRLDEILNWSARHNYHPVTMAWTYLGGSTLSVDLFHIEIPSLSRRRPAPPDKPGPPPPPTRDQDSDRPTEPSPPRDGTSGRTPSAGGTADRLRGRRIREGTSASGAESDFEGERGLRANATTAIEHLYRTAPPGDQEQTFDELPVRGDWVAANLLGASKTRLFLGVLGDHPSAAVQARLRERRLANLDAVSDSIQVDVFGRLIVAVSLNRDAPPRWEDVAARLA